jgi:protein-disulfide isomerase
MSRTIIIGVILFCFIARLPLGAQTGSGKKQTSASRTTGSPVPNPEALANRVEKYLRNLYAWGPSFEVKVGPSKPSPVADLFEVPVTVSKEERSDNAVVYVTKDGNFLIRGELSDMAADPFAEIRSKLHPGNSPSMGPEDAKITLIEFADLECPSCRQLDLILREYLPSHPEVRLVFKHFPLTEIHPWAMTAAIATQCAFLQRPTAFWEMHDAIYDSQDLISPSNVWEKMLDLAGRIGLNLNDFKACMAEPGAANDVRETLQQGHSLNVTATPTTFVNGRRVVGPDKSLIDQYVSFSFSHD